jgi:hypothetical protein
MYKYTDAKKTINSIDNIIKDSNYYTIQTIEDKLLNDSELDDKSKDKISQVIFSVKDEIDQQSLLELIAQKKKKKKFTRQPTEYNFFIKDNLPIVKEQNPDLNYKEVLSKVAELWNKQKELIKN